MVGWHHQFNGPEFEQTPGGGEGQGSPACCSPWGHKESDTTERLTTTTKDRKTEPLKGQDYIARAEQAEQGFKPRFV